MTWEKLMRGLLQVRMSDTDLSPGHRASRCAQLRPRLPPQQEAWSPVAAPSPHPCPAFVAPVAITSTCGPCFVASFLLMSLESFQLLWFYSEVSACIYDFLRVVKSSFSETCVPLAASSSPPRVADSSLVGASGSASQPRCLASFLKPPSLTPASGTSLPVSWHPSL